MRAMRRGGVDRERQRERKRYAEQRAADAYFTSLSLLPCPVPLLGQGRGGEERGSKGFSWTRHVLLLLLIPGSVLS